MNLHNCCEIHRDTQEKIKYYQYEIKRTLFISRFSSSIVIPGRVMTIQDCRLDYLKGRLSSALITLDVTEEVIDEAISCKCDVIISHHPLIFQRNKKNYRKNFTERILYKAVKHDIAIYSAHTNLDILQ